MLCFNSSLNSENSILRKDSLVHVKIRGPKPEKNNSEHNYSKALEIIVGLLCLEFIKLLHKKYKLEINSLVH